MRPLQQPKFFILRDRFDWDLNQSNIRPKVFAQQLVTSMSDSYGPSGSQLGQNLAKNIETQILEQIQHHIEKNINPAKTRLNRKEEEMVTSK